MTADGKYELAASLLKHPWPDLAALKQSPRPSGLSISN
jgi:hypothetical protein